MNVFNYMGMLLLSYLALYAAFRAGKAHLAIKAIESTLEFAEGKAFIATSNKWRKMAIWLSVCLISMVLVFKLVPKPASNVIDSAVKSASK